MRIVLVLLLLGTARGATIEAGTTIGPEQVDQLGDLSFQWETRTDRFDKDGARWKTWINFWSYRPDARGGDGQEIAYVLAGTGVDLKDDSAIRWRLPGTRPLAEVVAVNTGLKPEAFNPGVLGTALAGQ